MLGTPVLMSSVTLFQSGMFSLFSINSLVLRAHGKSRPVVHTLLPNHINPCPVFVRRTLKVCMALAVISFIYFYYIKI